jgi:hypothetical protein
MGRAHWHKTLQREVGHSGCLRVKAEGGKSRTHQGQCPEGLAPDKTQNNYYCEGVVLFPTESWLKWINKKLTINNENANLNK